MDNLHRISSSEFREGFDWVARELQLPAEHLEPLFLAVYSSLYLGQRQGVKVLTPAWTAAGAQWPSGFAYLQESTRLAYQEEGEWHEGDPLPEVSERELLGLLLMRFAHVAYRLQRNRQIRDFFNDPQLRERYSHIELNRHPMDQHALCGRGGNVLLQVHEGLRLMEQLTCAHPACRCTFDPAKRADLKQTGIRS